MVELGLLRRRLLLLPLLLAASCRTPGKNPLPAPGLQTPDGGAAPKAALLCANLYYGFTCGSPPGFLVTEESTGPGPLLTLRRRARGTAGPAALVIRVHPMHRDRLKWVVDERVRSRLKEAGGVKRLGMKKASVGGRSGFEVRALREAGRKLLFQRFFGFEQDNNAFIVEYAAAPEHAREDADLLDTFVSSIYFRAP